MGVNMSKDEIIQFFIDKFNLAIKTCDDGNPQEAKAILNETMDIVREWSQCPKAGL